MAQLDPEAVPHPGLGSDGYQQADAAALEALSASLIAAIAGDDATAKERAVAAGYSLCSGQDDEHGLLLYRPTDAVGRAWILLRRAAARSLQLHAPHAFFEGGPWRRPWCSSSSSGRG